jgi:hypothetical protein
MLAKPKSLTTIGIIQLLLASAFVIWLLFLPAAGDKFAWPVAPKFTAMFIGAGFIARAFIGYFLWREKSWPKLRWQVAANYAFLIVIFIATMWHIEAMNWKSSLLVAHIWVLAYFIEPITLYLIEPRGEAARAPLPIDLQQGHVWMGLKRVAAVGLVVSVIIGGLLFINPRFLDTRWPWPLDPFDARIMAAFFALAALWCVEVYFGENWGEVRLAGLGLAIIAVSNFIVWLVMLPQLDPSRNNIYTYGITYAIFAVLLIYYFARQERQR